MEPPRSTSVATLIAAAATLRDAGADVVDVADSPMAKMRMSAWAACRLVQDEAGIEAVLHFPTRGRNLLRLQGDLLGAHALGIRNLFVCVGDPVSIGEYPTTMNDVDVTATGLLELITSGFNEGRDRRGSTIGEPTSFFAGAAVAPAAVDLDREMRLLRRKIRSGAAFLLSQPVYDLDVVRRMRATYEREAAGPLEVPLLAGVLPLVSARHAEFLHNEVPGIVIPEPIRERMRRAGDGAWAVGREIAAELVAGLREAASPASMSCPSSDATTWRPRWSSEPADEPQLRARSVDQEPSRRGRYLRGPCAAHPSPPCCCRSPSSRRRPRRPSHRRAGRTSRPSTRASRRPTPAWSGGTNASNDGTSASSVPPQGSSVWRPASSGPAGSSDDVLRRRSPRWAEPSFLFARASRELRRR